MQAYKHESVFAEYIAEEELVAGSFRSRHVEAQLDLADRNAAISGAQRAVEALKALPLRDRLEIYWIDQLVIYIRRLQSLGPPSNEDEQFNHLYDLRKWLFWVPPALLQRQEGQDTAMVVVAHFYAIALALEPLYSAFGSFFCANTASGPLENIIRIVDSRPTTSSNTNAMMQYPRQAALNYRHWRERRRQLVAQQNSPASSIHMDNLDIASIGDISPGGEISALHYESPTRIPSQSSSSYLEVPGPYGQDTQSWNPAPSPAFPSAPSYAQEPTEYQTMSTEFQSGFVLSHEIWA